MKNVIIYTLNYCPFCKKALEFLQKLGIPFENIDVTYDEENMTQKIKTMFNLQGQVTFPQIIIDKQNIGGYVDLRRLQHRGQLAQLLAD